MKKLTQMITAVGVLGLVLSGCGEKEHPEIEITIKDYGTIKAELDPEQAPITVENFISLAEGLVSGGAGPGQPDRHCLYPFQQPAPPVKPIHGARPFTGLALFKVETG